LLDARSSGAAANLPADVIESIDLATGRRAQELVVEAMTRPIAAWKVAVTPDGVVLAAPVFDNLFFAGGVSIPLAIAGDCGMECEIAFKMAKDMPPRATPYSADDVAANVESACVTVELLHSRLPAKYQSPRNAQLADLLSNAALVAGSQLKDWRQRDLKNIAFEFKADGTTILARNGGHPTGDPFGGVIALANHFSSRGMTLKAGTIVTTGSYSGVHFAPKGGRFHVRFDGFPPLAFTVG
jgi:2-keto-4-pentenoate hydratase